MFIPELRELFGVDPVRGQFGETFEMPNERILDRLAAKFASQ
jgi:hypothetical protein